MSLVNKKALITGFGGQDSTFLSKILLDKGYEVYGLARRAAHRDLDFIEEYGLQDVKIIEGDLCDSCSINEVIRSVQPDECYNLGAMSHVGTSFKQPLYTADVTGLGPLRLLEAIRQFSPNAKFYQAGSSEEFGGVTSQQNEETALIPKSPYAAAKVFAHHICDIYKEGYGIYVVVGMLMNHESERRGKEFVTRKITDWIGRYINGKTSEPLKLGNLDAKRDWSHSQDCCEAMWLMMQQEVPKSYLVGSGESHTPREFLEKSLQIAGIKFIREEYIINNNNFYRYLNEEGKEIISCDPTLYRPVEVVNLHGDPSKIKKELGWKPKISFEELVKRMVLSDINKYRVN